MLQRRLARGTAGHRRQVDIAQPLFFVADVPLYRGPQLRADGVRVGLAGEIAMTSAAWRGRGSARPDLAPHGSGRRGQFRKVIFVAYATKLLQTVAAAITPPS